MTRPITATFVLPNLTGGGAERVVTTLLKYLDSSRVMASLVLINGEDRTLGSGLPDNLEIVDLAKPRLRDALPALLRLIWRTRPDVVLSTVDHLNVAAGFLRPFWPRDCKLVIRATDFLSLEDPRQRLLMRASFRSADAVIYQSKAMSDAFTRRLHLAGRPHCTIGNPLDVDFVRQQIGGSADIQFDPARTNLVSIGRLAPAKGFDMLLEAIARQKRSDLAVYILGVGAERGALERQARDLDIAHQVTFLGFRSNPFAILARADGLVLSSRYEGFPNVVLEALCCGTPVLSTPVPGVAEALAGLPGCMVVPDISIESLTEGLAAFLADTKPRVPAEATASHAADLISRQYEDILCTVANRKSAR